MTKYDLEELRDMAPFYIQGTLSQAEIKAFQEGLNKYPELEDDLQTYSHIESYYQGIQEKITPPTDRVFNSIEKNIDRVSSGEGVQRKEQAHIERMTEWLKELFTVPRIGWGVAAVQCVVIVFLLLPERSDIRYQTLSSSQTGTTKEMTIQLVFDETTTEKEIRRILTEINGEIKGGPSTEGMYRIGLPKSSDGDLIVSQLRTEKNVLFVEKAL